MKTVFNSALAVALAFGISTAAFAHGSGAGHGGGGYIANPLQAKALAQAEKDACAQNSDKCVGFGTHYYGQ